MYTFYHITYSKPYNSFSDLRLGDEITVGEKLNPYYEYFHNTDDFIQVAIPDGMQKVHYSDCVANFANNDSVKAYPPAKEFFPFINGKLDDLFQLNRELLLENVRLQFYPHMPSRLKCLWVTMTRDESTIWMTNFLKSPNLELITLESHDSPVKVDSMCLPLARDSLAIKEKKAHSYWSGQISNTPMIEYLFQGKATVKDINKIHFGG